MSHHSSQPFDFNKMDIEKMFENNTPDLVKHLNHQQQISIAESLRPKHDEDTGEKFKAGEELPVEQPENKFPDGKLSESDEGKFDYKLFVYEGRIIMNFDKPIGGIGFTKQEAQVLIDYLQSKLDELID